jgi:hypothetical protein
MRQNIFGNPLLLALFHPLNLATLGLSLAAGLLAAWWLFPAGLLVWLVMFVVVARDPSLRINQEVSGRNALAARFQPGFDRIQKIQVSIFNALNFAKPNIRRALQPVQEPVDRLTNQIYELCVRMSILENHRLVLDKPGSNPKDALQQLEQKAAQATDPSAKQQYEETRKSLQDSQKNLQGIASLLERTDAYLTNLATVLDGVLTEVLRMQALEEASIAASVKDVVATVEKESRELKDFEQNARAG